MIIVISNMSPQKKYCAEETIYMYMYIRDDIKITKKKKLDV